MSLIVIACLAVSICFPRQLSAEEAVMGLVDSFFEELQARGVDKVGDLKMRTLRKELGTVQFEFTNTPIDTTAIDSILGAQGFNSYINSGVNTPLAAMPLKEMDFPKRSTGFYEEGTARIYLPDFEAASTEEKVETILHEGMGALKYNDHNGAQSRSLMMIRNDPRLKRPLGSAYFRRNSLRYGGSSVGGGGDSTSMLVKRKVLQSIRREPVNSEFMVNYAGIGFEPLDEPDNQIVVVMYQFHRKKSRYSPSVLKGVRQDRKIEELFTIFYPRMAWRTSKHNRKQIIALAHFAVISLFPLTKSTPTEEFALTSGCKNETVEIPIVRAGYAKDLLLYRANQWSPCLELGLSNIQNRSGFEVRHLPDFLLKDIR